MRHELSNRGAEPRAQRVWETSYRVAADSSSVRIYGHLDELPPRRRPETTAAEAKGGADGGIFGTHLRPPSTTCQGLAHQRAVSTPLLSVFSPCPQPAIHPSHQLTLGSPLRAIDDGLDDECNLVHGPGRETCAANEANPPPRTPLEYSPDKRLILSSRNDRLSAPQCSSRS
ncbi:hypothetical protein D9611_005323 [Ephemerocybe angulata]|uniref:Uncharacterized protein n=1 Tax=Ephemerocybe angulata TaxID=980116 RepID=A0A8H5C065_9AGAR|nr:hypothetical protein D9611_005323 [Tulosesus angulatus]